MPWWGWSLLGLVLGGALVGALAFLIARQRSVPSQQMAAELARAEARIRELELDAQRAEGEARAEGDREATVEAVGDDAKRIEGDTETQIDDVMGHL